MKPSQIAAARLERTLLRRLGKPIPSEVAEIADLDPSDVSESRPADRQGEQPLAVTSSSWGIGVVPPTVTWTERKENVVDLLRGESVQDHNIPGIGRLIEVSKLGADLATYRKPFVLFNPMTALPKTSWDENLPIWVKVGVHSGAESVSGDAESKVEFKEKRGKVAKVPRKTGD